MALDMSQGTERWTLGDLLVPMAVRVAATLRLADHIDAGVRTPVALADFVDADPDALGRLMRHLANAGVLTVDEAGAYGLTELGKTLKDDDPHSKRAIWDMEGALGHSALSAAELLHTVRHGEPAYPRRYGRDVDGRPDP